MEENQLDEGWPSIDIVRKNNLEEFLEPKKDCCIYRVPQFICKLLEAAYTPSLISIGPLRYGKKELMAMESQKKRYRTSVGGRAGVQALKDLKNDILAQQQSIRNRYSVTSKLSRSEYAAIILHDVIFIMELFLRKHINNNDFLLKSPIASYIAADLLVLENQLPYSLLNDSYSKVFPSRETYPSFFDLFRNFFGGYLLFKSLSFEEIPQEFKHFIDFLRHALVMEARLELKQGDKNIAGLPCATKLRNSGLKFKGTKDKSLLDIQFAKTQKYGKWLQWLEANELQIPTLEIYDETEILLRNLMAWEMFHHPTETHICNYADLMDHLIDTKEDVDLLVEKEIIVNHVGENEAIAKMFNRLCSHIVSSESCYSGISRKMIEHYNHPWNHAKATLKRVYFSNLWTGTATVAATFLLIITLMQTICSVIQVQQGHTKSN